MESILHSELDSKILLFIKKIVKKYSKESIYTAISLWNNMNPEFKLPDKEIIIDSHGSLLYIIRNWISKSESIKLFEKVKTLEWVSEKTIFGEIAKSRQVYAIGNSGLTHKYSSQKFKLTGWDKCPELKLLMDKINSDIIKSSIADTDESKDSSHSNFTSCLLNKYSTGDNYLGYHSDKDALGFNNAVCTVSLGESRDILFKNIKSGELVKCELKNSDLVIMSGNCQKQWKHSIPKRKNKGMRISITYRCVK